MNISSLSISTGQDSQLLWTSITLSSTGGRSLERIKSGICTIDYVSENGDISINLHKEFPTLIKGYQITAKRKYKISYEHCAVEIVILSERGASWSRKQSIWKVILSWPVNKLLSFSKNLHFHLIQTKFSHLHQYSARLP